MFCNKCGNPINQNTKFCEKCGNNLQTITQIPNVEANPTPQNLNQNVPSQYPNTPNTNNNNKTLMYVLIAVGVIAAILIVRFVAFSYLFTNVDNIKDEIQDELDKTDNGTDDEINTEEESKRVGSTDFGYVSVPNDWTKYVGTEATATLQYASPDEYVITLYAKSTTEEDAEAYATSVFQNMEAAGATGVTGATVTMGDYDAFQVYGYYPTEKLWVVAWTFEPGDGKTHYIAVEGPDRYSENYDIPNSYALDK